MSEDPGCDLEKAHRFFSAECFNRAWNLIDKPSRTPDEDRTMLQLGLASLWHWTQRSDRKPINLSVGNWQVSRIYSLLRQADPACQYGQASLRLSRAAGDFPFHQGYAFEALARAESISRDSAKMEEYLRKALELSENIPDPDDKKQLLADLATIK